MHIPSCWIIILW